MVDITGWKQAEATRHALYQASLQIQEPMGLEDRLARLLQTARDVLHLDRLSILLADPEGRWLEGVATLGTKEPAEAMRVPIGPEGGGLADAYLSQQPVIWADSQAPVPEGIRLQHPYNRLEAFRSRAFVLLPLVVQGRSIGAMGADRKHTRRPLEPALLPLLQLFAGQAAIAIENSRLFEQVQDGRERLRTLSHQLVEIQEAERQHIARELHDEIGQALTGLKLSLEMSKHVPPGAIRPRLDEALALVNELMAHARDLSLDLRPAMLDDLGLLPTLLWYVNRYTAQTGIQVTFKHTGLEKRFASEVETAAYRIVQEALTNVARHAGVNEVMVRLWADQDKLEARIEDHGAGFDPRAALASSATSGLAGMRERAVSLGGQLTVESSPGIGARLRAEFPLGASVERRGRERDAQDGDRAGG
jgi:signal transduction histidine kinase